MSTRYNTGNPIESTDVRDMSDNAKNLDIFSLSNDDSFQDRLGIPRKTLTGAVKDIGIPIIGDFTTGCTVTTASQGVQKINGSVYRWKGELPKSVPPSSSPSGTGGVSPLGEWVDVGDASLRSDLNSSGGADLVRTNGGRTVQQRFDAIPEEVDAAGTASSLINQHNNDYFAHTHLTEQIAEEVHRAELAADEAEAARDAAIATAGPLCATIAEGRAAVADGQTFAVQGSGGIAANVYRRINASSETRIASLPSADLVYTTFDPNVNLVSNGDFRHGLAGYLAADFDDIYKFYPDGAGHILVRPEFISTPETWDILPSFVVPSNAESRIYVKPGEVYTCSLEFDVVSTSASDTATIAVLSVRCHDAGGVQLVKSDFNVNKLNCSGFDNGKRNYTTITAPANASYIQIHIYCINTHTFSRYGFGKVKLERGAAMTPFVASRDSFTDTSNLSYDPLSIIYPPKLTNAVLETDSYGESVVVGTQLNTVADLVNLYETNRIAVKEGDILTLAFELDAAGTTGSQLAAQLRGFSLTNGGTVWEKRRYLPVAGFPQWELKDHTRTWTCVSGLIPAGIDYVVGRLVTVANSNYSKVRARRFSVKRGMNNYTFSQYNKDPLTKAAFNAPSALPSDFEFWPKGWRDLGNAEYDQDNWENVRDGFGGSYLSLKQSCVESALPFSIVSERYAVTQGENITYSLKLAGQLNAGDVVVQLSFFDANGVAGPAYNLNYPASAFSQSYFTINKTHVVPSGMTTAIIRVARKATALGTSLYVKDPLLIKGVTLPVAYQPQGDIRTISDKFTDVNGELVSIKDDIEELKDAAGSLAYGVVGWAIDSHGNYYTGEATNEFVQKPTTISASPAVTPVVVPVTAATALPGMRKMIMAPGIAKTGTRLWSVFSTSLTSTGEGADDFNIIQYSDDDGVTWKEAFYWKCSTLDYRLNTPHVYLESDGGLTFFTGYDVLPIGSDTTLGAWAFTIKNPQKTSGVFNITRQWRVLPTGYPNCIFESDGRKLLIGGTPTTSTLTDYKGINFYKYDHKNRWLNREANYLPSYTFWAETQVVQLANGSHMLMYRDESTTKLKVAYSPDGLNQFGAASDPAFLTATTAARFALRVSPSGRLYIVYNASTQRKMMTLALLNETGTSVVSSILLEPRQTENATYPDLKFDGDAMYIAWDFIRTTSGGKSPEIVLGKLSEADFIANGSSAVITRTIIATKNPNPYV